MTHFNRLDPWMNNHILDGRPVLWIWFQHFANQTAACTWAEVVDRRWAGRYCRIRIRTCCGVRGVQRIRSLLGCAPGKFLEVEAIIHNTTCPDIHESRIVGWRQRWQRQKKRGLIRMLFEMHKQKASKHICQVASAYWQTTIREAHVCSKTAPGQCKAHFRRVP